MKWPIEIADVEAAAARLAPHLTPTALRSYAPLDAEVGGGIRLFVKHENHQPTQSFKVRNALSVMTRLDDAARQRGVIAATRGNHGAGLAWAGQKLGIPVTIVVPHGNSSEKNTAMRGLGAELIEHGKDYDEALAWSLELQKERDLRLVHSTNDADVIAGAATLTLEILAEQELDALVIAVGGGSQAVGALTVARTRAPELLVFGVQAAGASAIHDSWHAHTPLKKPSADTFADGLATRSTYDMTFPALRAGLKYFTTVTDDEIAEALRVLLSTTHNLVEGAGAAGLAGVFKLRDFLRGMRVGIVLSGANIDLATLRRVLG